MEKFNIIQRPRRLRRTAGIRDALAETLLKPEHFVYPIFVQEGENKEELIASLPGQKRWSMDRLPKLIEEALAQRVTAFALFPKIEDNKKFSDARECLNPEGLVPTLIRKLKAQYPQITLYSDIALDPFSSDGHDGIVRNGKILNDETVHILAKMALVHAEAGVDFVAPSDMMDGRIGAIRDALEAKNFTETGIMAYAAKYASCFYGPFRDALDSAPKAGDKKTYQMDPRNGREAVREVLLDQEEGADIVMVKPAGAYLDVIQEIKRTVDIPVAAYQVSGEYSMLKFGAERGLFDGKKAMEETIVAIRRAGADLIFTYFAIEMARALQTP